MGSIVNIRTLNCYIYYVYLSMFAKHGCLPMLKVTVVTFESNFQIVLLNMSSKVAVALNSFFPTRS